MTLLAHVLRHQLCLCFVAAMILRTQRLKAKTFQPTLTWTCVILALSSPWATSCPILLNVRSSRRRPRPQPPHLYLPFSLPLRGPQVCSQQRSLRPLRRGRRRWSRSPRTPHQKAEDLRTKATAKSTQANKLLKQLQGNVYSTKVVEDLNKFEEQFQHLALTHDTIFSAQAHTCMQQHALFLEEIGSCSPKLPSARNSGPSTTMCGA